MKNDLVTKGLNELLASASEVKISEPNSLGASYVDEPGWLKWKTRVLSILIRVFGEDSPHYQSFQQVSKSFRQVSLRVCGGQRVSCWPPKRTMRADTYSTWRLDFRLEVLGDFVALAKAALADGHKDVAAVLASAALEDALKRFALNNDLPVSDRVMQDVVAALKSKGLVGGAQKSLLDTMPKLRDYAMHANWDKLKPEDVNSIIGYVEQFLLSNF